MQKFSDDIEALLSQLDGRGGGLRKRSDVGLLFELAASNNDFDGINAMIFNGKIIWNTYGVLRKASQEDENYSNLEKEFMLAINELRTFLFDYGEQCDEQHKKRIEETYLGMSQGTIRNIVDLAHDLAEVKNLQNDNNYSA